MRQITPIEIISLREMLQMESNALAKAKVITGTVSDAQLKSIVDSGIVAAEGRIRGLQAFITENDLINTKEVQ